MNGISILRSSSIFNTAMTIKRLIVVVLSTVIALTFFATSNASDENKLLIFCYHDIPKTVNQDVYGVDRTSFVQQIEYMRLHDYAFVSLDDVIRAQQKEKPLPPKAVLLTFDDAYLSFYEFVYPILKFYNIPSVLAVVPSWLDHPPTENTLPLMNWKQLKAVAQSGMVEIASHTYDLHKGVIYNPQGNSGPAVSRRIYDENTKMYETEGAYRSRLREDFRASHKILEEKLDIDVRSIAWPYGKYTQIAVEEARKSGFEITFSLGGRSVHMNDISVMPRIMIKGNPKIEDFIADLKQNFTEPVQQRIVHVDLDLLYDSDPVAQQNNLDEFIERIYSIKPSTVYLQAFCDDKGDGNIFSVYFPNRVLPMKADLFSYVVNQLYIRDIEVYAWMPMLSVTLPDEKENRDLRVMEYREGQKRLSSSWYRRLSPFSSRAREKLVMLYEDMAMHARIHGVVFQDDGYLNDFEDFNSAAVPKYRQISGDDSIPYQNLSLEQKIAWTRVKTQTLIDLTNELKKAVLRYRPEAYFVRTLYAPVLTRPESEEWFAQNYEKSLNAYDYVLIMAYPLMERVTFANRWLKELVRTAAKYPQGLSKTVFKVQAYDWKKERSVKTKNIDRWLRILVSAGAKHIGYYPDNTFEDHPQIRVIRNMISTDDTPFKTR